MAYKPQWLGSYILLRQSQANHIKVSVICEFLLSEEEIENGLEGQWEDLLPRQQSDNPVLSPFQEKKIKIRKCHQKALP